MKIARCETCRGRKKILALGGIMKDCKDCKGVGHVEAVDDEIGFLESVSTKEDSKSQDNITPITYKKRGRKPKEMINGYP